MDSRIEKEPVQKRLMVSLPLSLELRDRLRGVARAEGNPITAVIRRLLVRGLDAEQKADTL